MLNRAVKILQDGGLVAYPTDTLYGLGCDPSNGEALRRLFDAKKRSTSQTVPLLLAGTEEMEWVGSDVRDRTMCVGRRFWPGALTLVMVGNPNLRSLVRARDQTVAVRVPANSIARFLAKAIGGAIVGTSANLSGGIDPVTPQQVTEQLEGRVDLILDDGPSPGGRASTILDVSQPVWRILREGPVTREDLVNAGFDYFLDHSTDFRSQGAY